MSWTVEGDACPFLTLSAVTQPDSLAILHLRRDSLVPTVLHSSDTHGTGYAEGCVATTRFGSYPHSTLLEVPWGTQVIASQVDTGSRGRKRKRVPDKALDHHDSPEPEDIGPRSARPLQHKAAVRAASGFCHIVPPTPEAWTQSLPHRTQVVYTPDYSFVIQQLRLQPGSVVIEAGAGSGSFTHAAARAVFDGNASSDGERGGGHVYSFEYHEPRVATLRAELQAHRLDGLVTLSHRDVYTDGFALSTGASPRATAVFLDLPAPWTALPHLARGSAAPALDPARPVHLCAFLPCIEQAQRMAAALRSGGWSELHVHELAQRRLEVRRERVGLRYEGLRGVHAVAGSVGEALARLRVVQGRARGRRSGQIEMAHAESNDGVGMDAAMLVESKAERLTRIAREAEETKPWRDGRLVCRTEPEIKTHTSYLVFAVLPRAWSAADEQKAEAKWRRNRGPRPARSDTKVRIA